MCLIVVLEHFCLFLNNFVQTAKNTANNQNDVNDSTTGIGNNVEETIDARNITSNVGEMNIFHDEVNF